MSFAGDSVSNRPGPWGDPVLEGSKNLKGMGQADILHVQTYFFFNSSR